MENTVFIYSKNGEVKALSLNQAKEKEASLKNEGWKHTATLDPCKFIEHICNDIPVSEFNNVINSIK
jgi:hypothetical protein